MRLAQTSPGDTVIFDVQHFIRIFFPVNPSIVRNGETEKFVAATQPIQSQDLRTILSYDPRISIYA